MSRRIVIAAIAAIGLASAQAYAQSEKTAAAFAFKKGKELMNAGKIAEACAAFEQSQKLDPQLGTQYNLARCFEKAGRLASAWSNYTELAAKDTNAGRRSDSDQRAQSLEPRLPKMLVRVAHPVDGLVVTLDGVDVTVLIGVESPVDPGKHAFRATAPAVPEWTAQIDFAVEGKTVAVDVPALGKAAEPEPPPVAVTPAKTAPPPTPTRVAITTTPPATEPPATTTATEALPGSAAAAHDADASSSGLSGTQKIGIGAIAAGVVAVGVGGALRLAANQKPAQAMDLCGAPLDTQCIDPQRRADADQKLAEQKSLDTDSVIAAGVGVGVIVVGGILLLVGAPPADAPPAQPHTAIAPVIAPDQIGFAVSGAF